MRGGAAWRHGAETSPHLIADFRELVGLTPGAFVKHSGNRFGSGEAEAALHDTTERLGID